MNTNEWERSYNADQGWIMGIPHVDNFFAHVDNFFESVPCVRAEIISDIYDDWWAVYNGMAV